MTVILPHQNDEKKIIELQKNILIALRKYEKNAQNVCFFEVNPLWIFLNNNFFDCLDKNALKEKSNKISKITVNSLSFINYEVILNFEITVDNTSFSFPLSLIKLYEGKDSKKENINKSEIIEEIKKIAEKINFPLSLKIFRLALCYSPYKNSFSIKDEVWVKLK